MSRQARLFLISSALVVTGLIVASVVLGSSASSGPTARAVAPYDMPVRSADPRLGSGRILVVVFSDLQCEACRAVAPVLSRVARTDPRVTLVFKQLPFAQHSNARCAAMAAEAARAQGRFWDMEELLFEEQRSWAEDSAPTERFLAYARQLGLDTDRFRHDIASQELGDAIAQDIADGERLGVEVLPTVYVNGRPQEGAVSDKSIRAAIDQASREARP